MAVSVPSELLLPHSQCSEVPALVCLPAACPPRLLIDVRGRRVLFLCLSLGAAFITPIHPSTGNRGCGETPGIYRHHHHMPIWSVALPALRPSNLVPPSSPVASSQCHHHRRLCHREQQRDRRDREQGSQPRTMPDHTAPERYSWHRDAAARNM